MSTILPITADDLVALRNRVEVLEKDLKALRGIVFMQMKKKK